MKYSTFLLAAAIGTSALSPASARPYTPAMSCNAAASLVESSGAVVLSTSPTTFDRFVSSYGFCAYDEYLERAFVQTRDTPACLIGYTCTPHEPFLRRQRGGLF
jgi:hypothetical protein